MFLKRIANSMGFVNCVKKGLRSLRVKDVQPSIFSSWGIGHSTLIYLLEVEVGRFPPDRGDAISGNFP